MHFFKVAIGQAVIYKKHLNKIINKKVNSSKHV